MHLSMNNEDFRFIKSVNPIKRKLQLSLLTHNKRKIVFISLWFSIQQF